MESAGLKIDFERLLAALSERDRKIAVLYAFGHTQEEIGAELGLTRRRIGQILANISQSAEIRRVNYREENI
jgi:DNA-directed RNA polymerase sigma subunit (sigma70/sigma32)